MPTRTASSSASGGHLLLRRELRRREGDAAPSTTKYGTRTYPAPGRRRPTPGTATTGWSAFLEFTLGILVQNVPRQEIGARSVPTWWPPARWRPTPARRPPARSTRRPTATGPSARCEQAVNDAFTADVDTPSRCCRSSVPPPRFVLSKVDAAERAGGDQQGSRRRSPAGSLESQAAAAARGQIDAKANRGPAERLQLPPDPARADLDPSQLPEGLTTSTPTGTAPPSPASSRGPPCPPPLAGSRRAPAGGQGGGEGLEVLDGDVEVRGDPAAPARSSHRARAPGRRAGHDAVVDRAAAPGGDDVDAVRRAQRRGRRRLVDGLDHPPAGRPRRASRGSPGPRGRAARAPGRVRPRGARRPPRSARPGRRRGPRALEGPHVGSSRGSGQHGGHCAAIAGRATSTPTPRGPASHLRDVP